MHLSSETTQTVLTCSMRVWVNAFRRIRAALHPRGNEREIARCNKIVSLASDTDTLPQMAESGRKPRDEFMKPFRRVAVVYLAASSWILALPLPPQSLSIIGPGLQSCWQIFIFKAALHKSVFKRFWVEEQQQRKKVPLVFYLSSKMRRLWCIRQSQRSSEW